MTVKVQPHIGHAGEDSMLKNGIVEAVEVLAEDIRQGVVRVPDTPDVRFGDGLDRLRHDGEVGADRVGEGGLLYFSTAQACFSEKRMSINTRRARWE